MRWAGHVAYTIEMRSAYNMSENMKGRDQVKNLHNGRIILKRKLNA
jgi:hypothetical protein